MKRPNKSRVKLDLDDFDVIEPNPLELVKECRIQPRLVFDYLREKAETDARIDGLKAELKVAQAEQKRVVARLDMRIRKKPEEYKVQKITESTVSNTIVLQPEYKKYELAVWKIEKLLSEAIYYRNLLEAAAKALDHRKSSIENLVKLHGQSYFSSPKIEDDNKDMMNEMERKKSVRNRSNRR